MAYHDEWLAAHPPGARREAARVLLECAEAAGAVLRSTFGGDRKGLLIRAPCAFRREPVTVAWLHAPREDRLRGFSFGSNSRSALERAFPADVLVALDDYLAEFEADPLWKRSRRRGEPPWQIGWEIHHDDVVANIDMLAERVERIIRRLAAL